MMLEIGVLNWELINWKLLSHNQTTQGELQVQCSIVDSGITSCFFCFAFYREFTSLLPTSSKTITPYPKPDNFIMRGSLRVLALFRLGHKSSE